MLLYIDTSKYSSFMLKPNLTIEKKKKQSLSAKMQNSIKRNFN